MDKRAAAVWPVLKRWLDRALRLAGIVALIVLALQWSDRAALRRISPPPELRNLEDFKRWQPERREATRIVSDGMTYYLVRGDRGRALASGPAAYLFDGRGNFIGWTTDLGDDHRLPVVFDPVAQRSTVELASINRP